MSNNAQIQQIQVKHNHCISLCRIEERENTKSPKDHHQKEDWRPPKIFIPKITLIGNQQRR